MVGAIAVIYGHDSKDDRVQTLILLCMIGNAMEDVAKQAGVTLGGKAAIEALKTVSGKALIDINKRIGFKLLTKFGGKGVVNLVKFMPLVGGAVGAIFDGVTCYTVGQVANRAFRPTVTESGLEAQINTAVVALEAQINTAVVVLEARLDTRATELKAEVSEVRTEIASLKAQLATKSDLKSGLAELETRLVRWMAGIVITTAVLTVAIVRLFMS